MKPCPFCGSHRVRPATNKKGSKAYIHCHCCGARGPVIPRMEGCGSETDTAARHEWEKREEVQP